MKHVAIPDSLIDLLLSVPTFHNTENRDALLSGLGALRQSIRRSNTPVADITSIVNSLEAVGQLNTGEWPLQIVIRNAQRYCPANTNAGRRLQELLEQYEASYERQKITQLPEIVIGTDERLPIAFLEKAIVAQRSVARLLVPRILNAQPMGKPAETATGTAWTLGSGLLLTNYHVVEARFPYETAASEKDMQDQAVRAVAWFGYNSQNATHNDYRCTQLVQANKYLDYALLRMEEHSLNSELPLSDWGQLSIVRTKVSLTKGTRLNIIQHPRGEVKRLAIRSNFFVGCTSSEHEPARMQYLTDTEPGASGSPVFDDDWQVVAMHHAAVKVPESQYQGEVLKYNNQGIEITAIIEDFGEHVKTQVALSQGWN